MNTFLLRIIFTFAFLFTIGRAHAQAGYAMPEGGSSIFKDDEPENFRFTGSEYGDMKIVPVSNQPFAKTIILSSFDKKNITPWNLQIGRKIETRIEKGDILILSFFARASSGKGSVSCVFEQAGPEYDKSLLHRISLSNEWTPFFLAFTCHGNYSPLESQLNFQAGFNKQVIEIADIKLFNFKNRLKKNDLPGKSFTEPDNPFEYEIAGFEEQDQTNPISENSIIFTGSSSIRLWSDLEERFKDWPVINRGFGGSRISDLLYFSDRLVVRHKVRQVVIYSGENDIAGNRTAEEVFKDFRKLIAIIHKKFPQTSIAYISIKPSPSREGKIAEVKKANALISSYIKNKNDSRLAYINIFDLMLDKEGKARKELFTGDMLHMNKAGYDIWEEAIREYLVR